MLMVITVVVMMTAITIAIISEEGPYIWAVWQGLGGLELRTPWGWGWEGEGRRFYLLKSFWSKSHLWIDSCPLHCTQGPVTMPIRWLACLSLKPMILRVKYKFCFAASKGVQSLVPVIPNLLSWLALHIPVTWNFFLLSDYIRFFQASGPLHLCPPFQILVRWLFAWLIPSHLSGLSLNVSSSAIPSLIFQPKAAPIQPKSSCPNILVIILMSKNLNQCQDTFLVFCLPHQKEGLRN